MSRIIEDAMATNGHGQGPGQPQAPAAPGTGPTLPPGSRLAGSRLGELLLRRAVITADQLAAVATEQTKHGGQFATTLVKLGFISDEDLTSYLHKEYRLPVIDPMSVEP